MLHVSPPHSAPLPLPGLLAACVRQERVAQRRLYGQFHGFAMGICLRYAHDRDQALEATNDGFLKVFRDLHRFDTARHPTDVLGSFRGWLKRIMVHTAIDQYRANERHQHQQELDDTTLNQAGQGATPLDTLSYDELLALAQRLPPAYWAVFNLSVIERAVRQMLWTFFATEVTVVALAVLGWLLWPTRAIAPNAHLALLTVGLKNRCFNSSI